MQFLSPLLGLQKDGLSLYNEGENTCVQYKVSPVKDSGGVTGLSKIEEEKDILVSWLELTMIDFKSCMLNKLNP